LRPVTILLRGGIGNQLFQICAGETLRAEKGRAVAYSDILLSRGFFWTPNSQRENFSQLLGLPQEQISGARALFLRLIAALLGLVSARMNRELRAGCFLTSQSVVSIISAERTRYLDAPGFDAITEHEVVRVRRLVSPLVTHKNLPLFAAVHIRLGDYRKFSEIYGVPSKAYLSTAFERIEQEIEAGLLESVFLFSDEPAEASEYVPKDFPRERIVYARDLCESDVEEFTLMTQASEIWISNSTFSWWAARISKARSVHYPKKFMGPKLNLAHYQFPAGWRAEP
jgi:hypothetical protein